MGTDNDQNLMANIRENWMIIAALVAGLLAWGETRWQVQELLKRTDAEKRQWELIGDAGRDIQNHAARIEWVEHVAQQQNDQMLQHIQQDHLILLRLVDRAN